MLKVIVILAIVLVIVDIAITVIKKLDLTTEKEKLEEFNKFWELVNDYKGDDEK